MKNLLRSISIVLTLLMIAGTVSLIFPASAAEGEGLAFEKDDMYVTVKDYDETPNTFEAWIKLPRNARNRTNAILSNAGAGNRIVTFGIAARGNPCLKIVASETVSVEWKFSEIDVCTGKWTHLAIVKNVAANTVDCYINGTLKQSLPIENENGCHTIPAGGLCIGGELSAGNESFFGGSIREIAVFSSARTKDEISADMTSVSANENLLSHYDLSNQVAGTNIRDISGNECHAKYKDNTVWIAPSEKEPVTDYAYSFAILGDTQKVNFNHSENFGTIFDWILNNIESKKIKHVLGLGDITDTSSEDEWNRAKKAYHSFDGKVGYSIIRGNHDSTATFNKAFPLKDYKDVIGGSFNTTMLNTYQTFSVGDVKYLIIALDFGPHDKVLEWAGELCEEYPDHNVVIITHAYLYLNGTHVDEDDHAAPTDNGAQNNGDDIWNKLVSKHDNIDMIISGHEACDRIAMTQRKGDAGNTVTELLINPQLLDLNSSDGLGLVAMFYFSEDGRDVTVEYYSTITEKFYRGINQFSFNLDGEEEELFPEETLPEDTTPEETTNEIETDEITSEEITTETVETEPAESDEITSEEITTQAVESEEDPVTKEPASSETTGTNDSANSGCGASISLGAGAIICVILGSALTLTRKKED